MRAYLAKTGWLSLLHLVCVLWPFIHLIKLNCLFFFESTHKSTKVFFVQKVFHGQINALKLAISLFFITLDSMTPIKTLSEVLTPDVWMYKSQLWKVEIQHFSDNICCRSFEIRVKRSLKNFQWAKYSNKNYW